MGDLLTCYAIEFETQLLISSLLRSHPFAVLPGRIVTHMTGMTACEFGVPVTEFIGVEAGDFLHHQAMMSGMAEQTTCPAGFLVGIQCQLDGHRQRY